MAGLVGNLGGLRRLMLAGDELLTTTRTVRRRLDLTRPVSRDVVLECLHIAFQAPTGSNRQNWAWVVVDDPAQKAAMADLYRSTLAEVVGELAPVAGGRPGPDATPYERMRHSAAHLADHLHEVPVLVVPGVEGDVVGQPIARQASLWGSILPAVWSFMLALRVRGLGSAWTTLHLHHHDEMARILGIPSGVTQAGLFPVAYTLGTDFRPADRSASEATVHWNHW
jgi:nitroreductase